MSNVGYKKGYMKKKLLKIKYMLETMCEVQNQGINDENNTRKHSFGGELMLGLKRLFNHYLPFIFVW